MRQSTQIMLFAGVAASVLAIFGVDHAMAGDFASIQASTLTDQTGAAGKLLKQSSVLLGAVFGVAGVGTFFKNAKDGFKEGVAKGALVPGAMVTASGLMFAVPTLTNTIARNTTGTQADDTITQTTGGEIGW